MATNKDNFTCGVCKQLYRNPVVHRLCGISFDRECIGRICPAPECQQVIKQEDLVPNYSLLQHVDEYRLTVEVPSTYYLILLDTSSSMWFSDSWLPFAVGESRSTCAVQFLEAFFTRKLNSTTEKVSLVTFDTSSLLQFDFQVIKQTHIVMLKNLEFNGKDTALFDCIDVCCEKLEQMKTILGNGMVNSYIFILTDGGNNFGRTESAHAEKILWRSRRLHISGHIIQIGTKNRRKTRTICGAIEFKYKYFKGGNVVEFADSFTKSIATETQARNRSSAELTKQLIGALPVVPDAPIREALRDKELA